RGEVVFFFFSSRRRHTRFSRDWSSDVCSSDLLANGKALELGGITASTSMLGGKVMLEENIPTGILIDNAIGLVSEKIPELGIEEKRRALAAAQDNCFRVGLTTVADAGLDRDIIELM